MASDSDAGGFWRHKKCREHYMTVEQGYQPRPTTSPVSLVVAKDNSSKFKTDESLGWSGVATELERFEVPGSHLELFEDPYLANMVIATEQALLKSTTVKHLGEITLPAQNESGDKSVTYSSQ